MPPVNMRVRQTEKPAKEEPGRSARCPPVKPADHRVVIYEFCLGGVKRNRGLRRLPIESVDFLNAGVADKQRRSVRGEAGPVSEGASGRLKPFQAEDALQFAIGDLQAEVALLVVENPVKIQIAPVSG